MACRFGKIHKFLMILCCMAAIFVLSGISVSIAQDRDFNEQQRTNTDDDMDTLLNAVSRTGETIDRIIDLLDAAQSGHRSDYTRGGPTLCDSSGAQRDMADCVEADTIGGDMFKIVDEDGDGIDDRVKKAIDDLKNGDTGNDDDDGDDNDDEKKDDCNKAESLEDKIECYRTGKLPDKDKSNCDEEGTLEEQIECLRSGNKADKTDDKDDKKEDEKKDENKECDSSSSGGSCLETDPSKDQGQSGSSSSKEPSGEGQSIPSEVDPVTGQVPNVEKPPKYTGDPLDVPGPPEKELCVCIPAQGIKDECVKYRDANGYDQAGLQRLNYLFRDWHVNDVCDSMDPRLYDLLYAMRFTANSDGGFNESCVTILSAYRTPATNAKVGGASKSKHMRCKASDFKFSTQRVTDCGKLYAKDVFAENLGLGCYPQTNGHVHPPDPGKQFWPRGAWCDCLDGTGTCGGSPPSGCYGGR